MLFKNLLITGVLSAFGSMALADEALDMSTHVDWESSLANTQTLVMDSALDEEEWTTISTYRYQIPYRGRSMSNAIDMSATPLRATQIKAEIFAGPRERCNAVVEALYLAHTPDQTTLTRYPIDSTGIITIPNGQLTYKYAVGFYQDSYYQSMCTLRLSTRTSQQPEPSFELIGTIDYQGGFRHRMILAVEMEQEITKLRVRVPNYCRGLEVVEVGGIKSGAFYPARLADAEQQVYELNSGMGRAIDGIAISLNGPSGQSCEIPVYALPKQL